MFVYLSLSRIVFVLLVRTLQPRVALRHTWRWTMTCSHWRVTSTTAHLPACAMTAPVMTWFSTTDVTVMLATWAHTARQVSAAHVSYAFHTGIVRNVDHVHVYTTTENCISYVYL